MEFDEKVVEGKIPETAQEAILMDPFWGPLKFIKLLKTFCNFILFNTGPNMWPHSGGTVDIAYRMESR